jgi:ABC-2 type transport system ATP-binding protein
VLISSHILPEIEQVCDRVIIINQGRVVASGTTAALRSEFIPEAEYTLVAESTAAALESILLPLEPKANVQETRRETATPIRHFSIKLPAGSALAPELLARIWAALPGKIRELHATPPSLEQIFIEATRRSWELETKTKK